METGTVKDVVQRGADLLDTKLGQDWPRDIDLDALSMASSWNCVLGQLFDSYGPGVAQVLGDHPQAPSMTCSCCPPDLGPLATQHGFYLSYDFEVEWDYLALDQEWRELIRRLRSERTSEGTA